MPEFDLVVLGGGPGGYACALRASQLGQSVAMIEKADVGGTCLHRGCIPTKALLHVAELADSVREAHQVGLRASLDGLDVPAMLKFKDGIVSKLHGGLTGLLAERAVTTVVGDGMLAGPRSVLVDGQRYQGRRIVLATGSIPRASSSAPLGERVISSDEGLLLDHIPERVVVLGGGVIGVEFASLWRSLGADVTIVELLPRLLAGEDRASSKALERSFKRRGIRIKTGVKVASVGEGDAHAVVTLETGDTIDADVVLVAVGRAPNTSGIGLEDAGVTMTEGFVDVDENLMTSFEGVYAIGDVVRGPQLAHRAFAHGIFVAEHAAGLEPQSINEHSIPRVVYSTPEVASVGLTEEQAREDLDDVTVIDYGLAGNGRSQILGTAGHVRIVASEANGVLGIHMVGNRVGELVGEAQLIHRIGIPVESISAAIHAHPTQNEAIGEAFRALAGKPFHSHT